MSDPVAAHRAAQAEEYGQFVCGDQPIFIDGARAFNPGHPVPAGHVELHDLKDQVKRVSSKKDAVAAAKADDKENS
jgi:hypothetical protein